MTTRGAWIHEIGTTERGLVYIRLYDIEPALEAGEEPVRTDAGMRISTGPLPSWDLYLSDREAESIAARLREAAAVSRSGGYTEN